MFDNFLEEEYHPSDPVFTHPRSSHLIFIGDVQSALDTDALSSRTMECRDVPGLYFIGEVVDVTGWLGGYNFQWAWASGHAAGMALNN